MDVLDRERAASGLAGSDLSLAVTVEGRDSRLAGCAGVFIKRRTTRVHRAVLILIQVPAHCWTRERLG